MFLVLISHFNFKQRNSVNCGKVNGLFLTHKHTHDVIYSKYGCHYFKEHWDWVYHGWLARWINWTACDVGEAKEGLENELWRRWSNGRVGEWAVTYAKRRKGCRISCDLGQVTERSKETRSSDGVWARPEVMSQAKYALETGPRILEYFNRLLGVQEPLPKHDILGLPRFVVNALENWGLISFG